MNPPVSASPAPAPTPTTTGGVHVRTARPGEYDAAGEVTVEAYAGLVASEEDDYVEELRDAAHRAAHTDLLVAVGDATGAVLGTVAFVLPGSSYAEVSRDDEAEFRMLAVRPDARGRGIGELLVDSCLDRARRHRCSAVAISTVWDMRAAHRLYARMGFRRAPERDWWPTADVELICYVKSLGTPSSE